MAKFATGNGGRPKGARNKLSGDFLTALANEFAEHGQEAIRIVRVERPHEFLKIVASLMPKELEITDNRLQEISDDEIEQLIEHARRQLQLGSITGNIVSGEDEATDREPARLLPALPKAT